jgi:hypothetical protein
MKKNIILLLWVIVCSQFSKAQTVGVEKSIYNVQAGILGVWFNHEVRLSDEITLRGEIGLDAGLRGGDWSDKTVYALTPKLALEPRWYYNIEKRNSKGKYVKNNSGNFLALGVNYYPDWFVISNLDNASVSNQITIIPKWGIRRTIAQSNFSYELGIGIGKRYYFDDKTWVNAADLHVRVGYTF